MWRRPLRDYCLFCEKDWLKPDHDDPSPLWDQHSPTLEELTPSLIPPGPTTQKGVKDSTLVGPSFDRRILPVAVEACDLTGVPKVLVTEAESAITYDPYS